MDIIDAIRERRSVKNFDGQPLSAEMAGKLGQAIAESSDLFGGKVTIRLKAFDLREGFKPKGNYSVLDCGIGLCHFSLAERHQGRQGAFFKSADAPAPSSDLKCLLSYR